MNSCLRRCGGPELRLARMQGEDSVAFLERCYLATTCRQDSTYEGEQDQICLQLGLKQWAGISVSSTDTSMTITVCIGLVTNRGRTRPARRRNVVAAASRASPPLATSWTSATKAPTARGGRTFSSGTCRWNEHRPAPGYETRGFRNSVAPEERRRRRRRPGRGTRRHTSFARRSRYFAGASSSIHDRRHARSRQCTSIPPSSAAGEHVTPCRPDSTRRIDEDRMKRRRRRELEPVIDRDERPRARRPRVDHTGFPVAQSP